MMRVCVFVRVCVCVAHRFVCVLKREPGANGIDRSNSLFGIFYRERQLEAETVDMFAYQPLESFHEGVCETS